MPYIQRNWKGEIVGLYASRQPQEDGTDLTEPDPLPDDHPEVLAYLAKLPPMPPLPKFSLEDHQRHTAEHNRITKEHEALSDAVKAFNQIFSGLELALSGLLYTILNLPTSQLAYAIYYSPTSFDPRVAIVNNCIQQLASEHKQLEEIAPLWDDFVEGKLQKARRLRNTLAHGSQSTLYIRNKPYARFTAPSFDVIRIRRKIVDGQIPGLTANEITEGIKNMEWVRQAIDHFNRLIAEYHDGNPSLLEKFGRLKKHLTP